MKASAAQVIDRVLKRNAAMQSEWDIASAACKKHLNRKTSSHGNWLFRMFDGNKVENLGDQFSAALNEAGIKQNAAQENYSLYSLRHTYAVEMLREGTQVFALARNMGCDVQMIQRYYGKHATAVELATSLGG